jgi:hypothetical protein
MDRQDPGSSDSKGEKKCREISGHVWITNRSMKKNYAGVVKPTNGIDFAEGDGIFQRKGSSTGRTLLMMN